MRFCRRVAVCLLATLVFPMAVYAAGFGAYKADVKPADVFPGAEKFGPVEGAPPAAAAYRNGVVAGYVIETSDIGYSGKPIRILAGLDNNGTITGAKVIEHHEPILLVGISPDKLFGVVLHGCNRAIVRNNRIANRADLWPNDRGNGIHIWNNTGALVEGNTVTSGRDGLYIEISHDNVIRGNRFEGMRFAVHYMYANNNEVSGNISIRNHVGFALMYSKGSVPV